MFQGKRGMKLSGGSKREELYEALLNGLTEEEAADQKPVLWIVSSVSRGVEPTEEEIRTLTEEAPKEPLELRFPSTMAVTPSRNESGTAPRYVTSRLEWSPAIWNRVGVEAAGTAAGAAAAAARNSRRRITSTP